MLELLKNSLSIIENLHTIKGGNDENPNRPLLLTPRQISERIQQLNINLGKKPRNNRP